MLNFIGIAILLAVAALLVWSAFRARRLDNTLLKWGAVVTASLLATAVAAVSLLAIIGLIRVYSRSAPVPALKVNATAAQIQRGRALAAGTCDACHSTSGNLTGGMDVAHHIPIPLGSLVASNLTPAGQLRHWSDGEVFRAIRNGVDADGNWLVIMSYSNLDKLSDADTEALIAYLRSLPAAGEATRNPPDRLNLLGVILLGAHLLPGGQPIFAGAVTAPPKGPTAKYGEYILSYQDCRLCHGANLTGGVPGQLGPIGPDLNLVKHWTLQEFIDTLRTGTAPGGHQVSAQMPWQQIGKMDDEELAALYDYLAHMP